MYRFIKRYFFTFLMILAVCSLCACSSRSDSLILESDASTSDESAFASDLSSQCSSDTAVAASSSSESHNIYVFVCGAVAMPGVYELTDDARAVDAIRAAGGLLESADPVAVNQACVIADGTKLYIPTKDETKASQGSTIDIQAEYYESDQTVVSAPSNQVSVGGTSGLININSADIESLCTLPGIGEGYAARIIEYRDSNGGFQKCEDIMQVKGIKQKLYDKIKDKITV